MVENESAATAVRRRGRVYFVIKIEGCPWPNSFGKNILL